MLTIGGGVDRRVLCERVEARPTLSNNNNDDDGSGNKDGNNRQQCNNSSRNTQKVVRALRSHEEQPKRVVVDTLEAIKNASNKVRKYSLTCIK